MQNKNAWAHINAVGPRCRHYLIHGEGRNYYLLYSLCKIQHENATFVCSGLDLVNLQQVSLLQWLCHSYETSFCFLSSHSHCAVFSVSQTRWQRLECNSLLRAFYNQASSITRPVSVSLWQAVGSKRQLSFFYSQLIHIPLTAPLLLKSDVFLGVTGEITSIYLPAFLVLLC